MSKSSWMNPPKLTVQLQDDTGKYLSKLIGIFFESLRGIYYQRAIYDCISELRKKDAEWYEAHVIYLAGVCLDISVIAWAKLFGSEQSQDTHFIHLLRYGDLKECLSKKSICNKQELEQNLLTSIGITKADFESYKSDSIIKYRDQFLAHMDLKLCIKSDDDPQTIEEKKKKQLKKIPILDIAKNSLYWLYGLITELLNCKLSDNGNYHFAIYVKNLIDRQVKEECLALIASLKHRD